jgi:hypothetical protein
VAETKHTEEDHPVRMQPIRRRRADLAGNDGPIERGQLVDGTFSPVSAVAAMQDMSGPLR